MTAQAWLWTGAAAALALALAAGIADWRLARRRRGLDAVGWVPWCGVQVLTLFAALALAVLAFGS